MERREFIKTSCSLCIALGAGALTNVLSSCSPLPVYRTEIRDNTIVVPLSLFAENDFQIIRPGNFGYDIALRKLDSGSYLALLLRCTHADTHLNYNCNDFFCRLH